MATKRKQNEDPEKLTRAEYRAGVREYASRLLATLYRKRKGDGLPLPKHTEQKTMSMGCIRWGIVAMQEEEKHCMSEQDVQDREAFQEQLDESEGVG